jgi:hypothetical protein
MNRYRIPKGTTVEVRPLDMSGVLEETGVSRSFGLPKNVMMTVEDEDEGTNPVYHYFATDEDGWSIVKVLVQASDLVKV